MACLIKIGLALGLSVARFLLVVMVLNLVVMTRTPQKNGNVHVSVCTLMNLWKCAFLCVWKHEMLDLDKQMLHHSCVTDRSFEGVCVIVCVCVCVWTHPLWEVKGCYPQRPETAEHGENSQAKVVSWWDNYEVIFALTVTGAVRLHREQGHSRLPLQASSIDIFYSSQTVAWQ